MMMAQPNVGNMAGMPGLLGGMPQAPAPQMQQAPSQFMNFNPQMMQQMQQRMPAWLQQMMMQRGMMQSQEMPQITPMPTRPFRDVDIDRRIMPMPTTPQRAVDFDRRLFGRGM